MSMTDVWRDGLWRNNVGLVQLLGLCPLLAISNSVVNALGLGLATTLVLVLSNLTVSLTRPLLWPEVRIAIFVLVIASVVSAIELLMNAFLHDLYRVLGIFIPLIVTNCAIIARAEAFASRNPPLKAAADGLATGLGFLLVLVALGAVRELIGQGSLFAQAHLLLGEAAWALELKLFDGGLLIALLPPGAFVLLALLIAGKNALDARAARPKPLVTSVPNIEASTS